MFLLLFTVAIANILLIPYFCIDYLEYFLIIGLLPFINQIYKIKNIKKVIEIKVFSNFDDDIKERINEIINSLEYDSEEEISNSSQDLTESSEESSNSSKESSNSNEELLDNLPDLISIKTLNALMKDEYRINNISNNYFDLINKKINETIDQANNEPVIESTEPVIDESTEPVIDESTEPIIDESTEPVIDERNIIQYDEATESEDSIGLNDVNSEIESVNSNTIIIEKVD